MPASIAGKREHGVTQKPGKQQPGEASVRAALRGNLWKSKDPRDYPKRRDLIGYLATKLLEGERAFVFFHVDGDRPWAEQDQSENVRKFKEFIETDVRQFVAHRLQQRGLPAGEMALAQLLLVVPYYSDEGKRAAVRGSCRDAPGRLTRPGSSGTRSPSFPAHPPSWGTDARDS